MATAPDLVCAIGRMRAFAAERHRRAGAQERVDVPFSNRSKFCLKMMPA